MFNGDIVIKGRQAIYVKMLTADLGSSTNAKIFKRNLDVVLIAPIVGMLFNRKSAPVKKVSTDDTDTKVFYQQVASIKDQLEYNFRMITLLENKDVLSIEDRCNLAFRYDRDDEKRKPADEVYNAYMYGGIEILYEKIFGNDAKTPNDYLRNYFEFLMEFKERYDEILDYDELLILASKAGK